MRQSAAGWAAIATIERLRGLDPKVNAIICSGYSDEAALSEFLAYGFRGALPKPFTRRRTGRRPATDVERSPETRNRSSSSEVSRARR